jgi:hypothetical protein
MVGSGETPIEVRTIRLDRTEGDPAVGVVAVHAAVEQEMDAGEGEDERMATSEERMMILRMVEQGKINAEEGARLLAALGNRSGGQGSAGTSSGRSSMRSGRNFRVRVTDNLTGQQKVQVNIPLALAEMGLRFVPKSAGIDVESIQQALDTGIEGRIVDVVDHEHGQRVEVFIE